MDKDKFQQGDTSIYMQVCNNNSCLLNAVLFSISTSYYFYRISNPVNSQMIVTPFL